MNTRFAKILGGTASAAFLLLGGNLYAQKVVVNEFYRAGNLESTDEWVEIVLLQDLTATQLNGFFFGDSTAAPSNSKFAAYQLTSMGSIASSFPKGTIIVVSGQTGPAVDTSYDPAGGDWNISLRNGGSNITEVGTTSNTGDYAATDVVWFDTASSGGTISADGFAIAYSTTNTGTLATAANVKVAAPSNNTGVVNGADPASAGTAANWTVSVASGSLTAGSPNGGANTTAIAALRAALATPTPTPSPTPTETPVPTPTETPVPTPTETPVPTPTETPVPTPTETPVPTPTETPVPTPTETPVPTPTETPAPTPTETPVPTPTETPVPTATPTPTPIPNEPVSFNYTPGSTSNTFTLAPGITATLSFASVTTGGTITLDREEGTPGAGASGAGLNISQLIDQYLVITNAGVVFTDGTLVITYDPALLGSILETNLDTAFKVDGTTAVTFPLSGLTGSIDRGTNTITINGINGFSTFYFGNSSSPVSDWMMLED